MENEHDKIPLGCDFDLFTKPIGGWWEDERFWVLVLRKSIESGVEWITIPESGYLRMEADREIDR